MRSLLVSIGLIAALFASSADNWRLLAPGMELGMFGIPSESQMADRELTILRVDLNLWDLEIVGISRSGESAGRTAKQWCETHNLTASINAGMFGTDYRTHVGYLRYRDHVNNSYVNIYQSVAAFDPKEGIGLPRFRIFDLDEPGVSMEKILRDFSSVVQNLRLIKRPGLNQWSPQDKRWSEAALGEDESGRVLFIFCRSPISMYEFNQALLSLDIGVVAVQHLEGGPEAQFYLSVGDVAIDMIGDYEAFFMGKDAKAAAFPIPNAIGIRPRAPAAR